MKLSSILIGSGYICKAASEILTLPSVPAIIPLILRKISDACEYLAEKWDFDANSNVDNTTASNNFDLHEIIIDDNTSLENSLMGLIEESEC